MKTATIRRLRRMKLTALHFARTFCEILDGFMRLVDFIIYVFLVSAAGNVPPEQVSRDAQCHK